MQSNLPTVFVTFGDGDFRYRRAASRLVAEAESTGIYTSCHNLDLAWLRQEDSEVCNLVGRWLEKGDIKGIGYWIWKSSILIWAAKNYPKHMIHYMDAGHVILDRPEVPIQIKEWIDESFTLNGLAWQLDAHLEIEWTKKETLIRLDPDQRFWRTLQIEGGFIILSSSEALNFGKALREIELERSGFYVSNVSGEPQFQEFKAHRHDQSIHSLLWKEQGYHFRTTETSHPGKCTAVVAARHASGFAWKPGHRRNTLQLLEFYLGKTHKFLLMHPNPVTKIFNFPLKRCR